MRLVPAAWAASLLILDPLLTAAVPTGDGPLAATRQTAARPATVISLNGGGWLVATDPQNAGREQKWWEKPRAEARAATIPWLMADTFPGYCGAFWYWRDLDVPANPCRDGRYLLRFWDVDYLADVWVNNTHVGSHEGSMSPFVFDVTSAVKPGIPNHIAVRVLLPGDTPIEGLTFRQTPHGAAGPAQTGGIMDSVELLVTPPVRVEDLFVRADPKTGRIRIQANLRNAGTDFDTKQH